MSKLGLCFFLVAVAPAGCTTAPTVEPLACATPADSSAAADVVLTARDATLSVDDVTFFAWTYDGDVPGPVLRLALGESRRIKLVNAGPRPVSVHFHGLAYSEADDGDPAHPASVVNPGCAHVSTVTATQPGVWPFHSALDPAVELSRGLYGLVVVPDPGELAAAHELVFVLANLGIPMPAAVVGGDGDPGESGAGAPTFFQIINGRPDGNAKVIELLGDQYVASEGTATAKVGDRVRFRVANLSAADTYSFHLDGHTLPVDAVALAPASGFTAELVEDNPGTWTLTAGGSFATYQVDP